MSLQPEVCKYLIFIDYLNNIHGLKNPGSATLGCRNMTILKSEFVAKTIKLYYFLINLILLEKCLNFKFWIENHVKLNRDEKSTIDYLKVKIN